MGRNQWPLTDPSLQTRFPRLKLAVWFEWSKQENQPGNPTVDWTVTQDPATLEAFQAAIPNSFGMAPLQPTQAATFARPGP